MFRYHNHLQLINNLIKTGIIPSDHPSSWRVISGLKSTDRAKYVLNGVAGGGYEDSPQ